MKFKKEKHPHKGCFFLYNLKALKWQSLKSFVYVLYNIYLAKDLAL